MGTFGGIRWDWTTTSMGYWNPRPSNFKPFLFEKNVKSAA